VKLRWLVLGPAAAALPLVGLVLVGVLSAQASVGGGSPTAQASADIPPELLPVYQSGAESCPGLPWSVLAAIGKVETDHGRSTAPGVTSGANFAGAAGPMQIGIGGKAGNTWGGAPERPVPPEIDYGTDGNGDGIASVYDPVDAIFSAAKYLCRNGADQGRDISGAVFAYNHANWYVEKVLRIAQSYATQEASLAAGTDQPSNLGAERAVAYAYAQLGKPYLWGAAGENGRFDCSGLTMRAWEAAGVALPHNSAAQYGSAGPHIDDRSQVLPGDLVYFAYDVTAPSTIHHVAIYIGNGKMIEAPHRNAVVRIANAFRKDYIGATRPNG
jgi:cell wall-associated NlpC family hydrolase